MIVAIDGPAGAGKSTVARRLAARLGAGYLDTGAMYRAVAFAAARAEVSGDDAGGLAALAAAHRIELEPAAGGGRVLLDGTDVTAAVRAPEVTASVSRVAAHGEVRRVVVAEQQRLMESGDWVADGRDIGTVVAPGAEVKVFLTATPDERARRRHAEIVAGGDDVALGDVHRQIVARDAADTTRSEAPLTVAADATVVDTTGLTIDEVVDRIAALVVERTGR